MARAAGSSGESLGFGLDFAGDAAGALAALLASEHAAAGETSFMGADTEKGAYMVVAAIGL